MADLSNITLPNNMSYNLKDAQAREDLAELDLDALKIVPDILNIDAAEESSAVIDTMQDKLDTLEPMTQQDMNDMFNTIFADFVQTAQPGTMTDEQFRKMLKEIFGGEEDA